MGETERKAADRKNKMETSEGNGKEIPARGKSSQGRGSRRKRPGNLNWKPKSAKTKTKKSKNKQQRQDKRHEVERSMGQFCNTPEEDEKEEGK